jgi:hypothetical protein
VISLAGAFYLHRQILLKRLNVSEIDCHHLSYPPQQKSWDYLWFVELRLRLVIVGDEHYVSLYREHVPVLLKTVPEANRRDLYPAGWLSARYMNAEEKQLSESIELP